MFDEFVRVTFRTQRNILLLDYLFIVKGWDKEHRSMSRWKRRTQSFHGLSEVPWAHQSGSSLNPGLLDVNGGFMKSLAIGS